MADSGVIQTNTSAGTLSPMGRVLNALAVLVTVVLVLCLVFVGVKASDANNGMPPGSVVDISDDWTMLTPDGKTSLVSTPASVTLDQPGQTVTLSRSYTVFGDGILDDATGMVLSRFISFPVMERQIEVLVDGESLYRVNMTPLSRTALAKGVGVVELPDTPGTHELVVTVAYTLDTTVELPPISSSQQLTVAWNIIMDNVFTIVVLGILLSLSLLFLFASFRFRGQNIVDMRVFSLLVFLVLTLVWPIADSPLLALLPVPAEMGAFLTYLTLMLVPLPIASFVERTCPHPGRIPTAFKVVSYANLLAQLAISIAGIATLNQMLPVTHLVISAAAVGYLWTIFRSTQQAGLTELKMLLVGFCLLSVLSLISVITYWVNQTNGYYRIFMLAGVVLFYASLLEILVHSYSARQQRANLARAQEEMFRHLALTDELTGLGNRRAFEERLKALEKRGSEASNDRVLVMLDLNGLKTTNDLYGHAVGDAYIVNAARCIQAAYGKFGTCCRIGGDEFAALCWCTEDEIAEADRRLEELVDECNARDGMNLSVAYGHSTLIDSEGRMRSTSSWRQAADIAMYANKRSARGDGEQEVSEMRDVIKCIVATVEAKDISTADHSSRVADLCELVAGKMGLSAGTIGLARTSGFLHDIGKVGISEEVLTKEGKLTAEEESRVRMHPIIGEQIVGCAESMAEVAHVIRCHHERWDGSGYPDGLSGGDIPLAARILAVVDSIDAMMSDRCYRPAMSSAECRAAIEEGMGTLFDPAVAQITLECWDEVEQVQAKGRAQRD